jgi:hypothetical protein
MRRAIARASIGVMLVWCGITAARADTVLSALTSVLPPTSVLFDDSTDNLLIKVFYGNQSVSFPVGGESFSAPLPAVLGFHFTNVDIYEPNGTTLSDTIRLVNNVFTFQSDGPGITLTPSAGATKIIETGAVQDAGKLTWLLGSVDIQFRSDVEGVPEPASWVLLLAAAALSAGWVWQRDRAKRQMI